MRNGVLRAGRSIARCAIGMSLCIMYRQRRSRICRGQARLVVKKLIWCTLDTMSWNELCCFFLWGFDCLMIFCFVCFPFLEDTLTPLWSDIRACTMPGFFNMESYGFSLCNSGPPIWSQILLCHFIYCISQVKCVGKVSFLNYLIQASSNCTVVVYFLVNLISGDTVCQTWWRGFVL